MFSSSSRWNAASFLRKKTTSPAADFSVTLRLLDTAEEIAFLALECERLGYPELATRLCTLYSVHDRVDTELFSFYRRSRALVRAVICAWRLREPELGAAAQLWRERTTWYLDVAAGSVALTKTRRAAR